MPTTRNYTGGSIVYFQGDMGDEVYVLQQGKMVLISPSLDSGEEIRTDVKQGEFFGVQSCLGRYPREETAQAVGKTVLISFKIQEFESFVLKNTRLIMKMLRIFSKQLRLIHRQVRDTLKVGAARDPSYELMNVAESFYRSGNFDHAAYAFKKYAEIYPTGTYRQRADELRDMAKRGLTFPIGYPPLEVVHSNGYDEAEESGFSSLSSSSDRGLTELFYEGLEHYSRGEFDASLQCFKQCADAGNPQGKEEQNLHSRAHYEMGRVQIKLEQMESARSSFSTYLKKFPTGEFVKESIFQLGVIAEAQGSADRARILYHKVATLPPQDETTAAARKRLEKLK